MQFEKSLDSPTDYILEVIHIWSGSRNFWQILQHCETGHFPQFGSYYCKNR